MSILKSSKVINTNENLAKLVLTVNFGRNVFIKSTPGRQWRGRWRLRVQQDDLRGHENRRLHHSSQLVIVPLHFFANKEWKQLTFNYSAARPDTCRNNKCLNICYTNARKYVHMYLQHGATTIYNLGKADFLL
jgi:hypothetical protein